LFVANDSIDVYPANVTIRADLGLSGGAAARINSSAKTASPHCTDPPEASAEINPKIDNISLDICLNEMLNTGQMTINVSTLSNKKTAVPPRGTTMNVYMQALKTQGRLRKVHISMIFLMKISQIII
jgi:hypothetical protein